MENSNLNNAHYFARKAESYLKSNENREESINFLNQCIDSLDKSLSATTSLKAAESIKLQRNHHVKMRDLIMHNNSRNERVINSNKIQLDLFENIDSTDTLLEELKKQLPDRFEKTAELQQINSQLNVLLFQLMTFLDDTVHENDSLKEKIRALETENKVRSTEKREDEVTLRELRDSPETAEAEFTPLDLPDMSDISS